MLCAGTVLLACLAQVSQAQPVQLQPGQPSQLTSPPTRATATAPAGARSIASGGTSAARSAPLGALEPNTPLVAEIEMYVGETRVIPQRNAGRLAVGSASVLSAAVLDDREILLIANGPGESSLHVWTNDGRNARLKVVVLPGDPARTLREIAGFLGEMPNVTTRTVGGRVVVDGKNLSEVDLFKIAELAKIYKDQVVNLTAVQLANPWERMVMMDVKVVEFRNDRLRDLGVRWDTQAVGPQFGIVGDFRGNDLYRVLPPQQSNGPAISSAENLPLRVSPFQTYFGIVSALSSRISALQAQGDAVILAEPQLAALSGRPAKFLAGGQIPYTVVGPLGQPSIAFQNFGIQVDITPRVHGDGRIHSTIRAEVSEPDATINPISGVPGLRSRRADTVFNVRNGETMVLAGLLSRTRAKTVDSTPGLGRLPLVGVFFRGEKSDARETELVVFVTPLVVEPSDAALVERAKSATDRAEAFVTPPPPPEPPAVPELPQ